MSPREPARTTKRMPTGFVAHGAPTLALDAKRGEPLRLWGEALPRPSAILCISAHWEDEPVAVEIGERPKTLYDFYGFPRPLYEIEYRAPGAPELAARVAELLSIGETVAKKERGWDHGVWVPLLHLFPAADVPLLQVSLPRSESPAKIVEMGRRLAPLRDEGVFILGSGNLTHNLRKVDFSEASPPPDWAREFDRWTAESLERGDIDALASFRSRGPGVQVAHPSDEHFTPLLAVAAAAPGERVTYPVQGFEYGTLSRRSPQLG